METSKPSIQELKIKKAKGEHVFILIEDEGGKPISIDIHDYGGYRSLGVRVNGVHGVLVGLDHDMTGPSNDRAVRFCPYCGKEQNLYSSSLHHECARDGWEPKTAAL